MRAALAAILVLLAAGAARAQAISPLTGATEPAAPAPPIVLRHPRTLAERFDAANTTHDGRLTRAQARAGHMNAVVRDFAAIDTGRKGYVTMDDIRAHDRRVRAARRPAAQ